MLSAPHNATGFRGSWVLSNALVFSFASENLGSTAVAVSVLFSPTAPDHGHGRFLYCLFSPGHYNPNITGTGLSSVTQAPALGVCASPHLIYDFT